MSTICKFISKRDGGALSIIYNAGINKAALTKTNQRHDIETVNVPATCDKLLTAVTQSTPRKESHIPYRVMSTLCYGALRIHQQQVNFLLDLSKNLLARSSNVFSIDAYTATKRKSSSSMEKMVSANKKRRLSITYKEQHKQAKKYTGLLDEMEALIKWSQMQICLPDEVPQEGSKDNIDLSMDFAPQTRRIQVRELMLRQYSAEIELPADAEEDCGFGNATENEIKAFMDYFKQNDNNSNSLKSGKRKSSAVHLCYEKVSKDSFDATIELARCLPSSSLHCDHNVNIDYTIPLDGKVINNTDTVSMLDLSDRQRSNTTNFLSDNANIVEFASQEHTIVTSTPKSQTTFERISATGNDIDMRNGSRKRKRPDKLIIDECIMFTEIEMRAQITAPRKRLCVQLPQPKEPNANEMLQRTPVRVLMPRVYCHPVIKRKPKRKTESSTQSEKEYLDLLREIVLPLPMNDQLAESVYANWQHQQVKTQQLKRSRTPRLPPEDINHNELQPGLTGAVSEQTQASAAPGAPLDWSPYGVMMQLTDIWRHATVDDIDAKAFLLNSKNRMNAAIAFTSLLVLAGKQFINISKYDANLQMDKITLGSASARILDDLLKCDNGN